LQWRLNRFLVLRRLGSLDVPAPGPLVLLSLEFISVFELENKVPDSQVGNASGSGLFTSAFAVAFEVAGVLVDPRGCRFCFFVVLDGRLVVPGVVRCGRYHLLLRPPWYRPWEFVVLFFCCISFPSFFFFTLDFRVISHPPPHPPGNSRT